MSSPAHHAHHHHHAPQARPYALDDALAAHVRSLVDAADHVLVAAGAGMSVDAGYDYTDEASFVARYPRLAEHGVRCRYQTFGYAWPSDTMKWGWIAQHLRDVRYTPPPNPAPYADLLALTADKSRFVLTSNADDLFARSGFDPAAIWTRQGSYRFLQCMGPCSDDVWSAEAWMRAALPKIDWRAEELADASLFPRCPRCGRDAFMNVRGGDWFVDAPYAEEAARFASWLRRAERDRLLVLDVGTGFNTPSVIRWPAEHIVANAAHATLVRVNVHHAFVPASLGARAIGVAASGAEVWRAVLGR